MATKREGERIGKLTILDGYCTYSAGGNPVQTFKVRCDCGNTYDTNAANLRQKSAVRMCKECKAQENKMAADTGYKHPLFRAWWSMITRCHDETAQHYKCYGGRGIKVCEEWRGDLTINKLGGVDGFHQFVKDMGNRPPKHSIDRINNDGNYEPVNCRWATTETQSNNKRSNVHITFKGETKTISQWAINLGIGHNWAQIARDYDIELDIALDMLHTSPLTNTGDWQGIFGIERKRIERELTPENTVTMLGSTHHMLDWCDQFALTYEPVIRDINNGIPKSQAIIAALIRKCWKRGSLVNIRWNSSYDEASYLIEQLET